MLYMPFQMHLKIRIYHAVSSSSISKISFSIAPSTNACSTPACKAAASNILDAIDCTTNPCTDFYQFACGGWKADHQIPNPRNQIGTYEPLLEKMTEEIRQKLAKFNNATDGQSSSGCFQCIFLSAVCRRHNVPCWASSGTRSDLVTSKK